MLSPNNQNRLFTNSKLVRLSLLIGLGIILFLFESFIPRPLPWLKPGFAHIATLMAMYLMGNGAAIIVVLIRVLVGSLLLGSLFNPAFILAMSGGIAATLVMGITNRYFSQLFSIFGISILGALVHNLTQLILVELLLVQSFEIFYLAPFMMLSSIFTGFVVALAANLVISKISSVTKSN